MSIDGRRVPAPLVAILKGDTMKVFALGCRLPGTIEGGAPWGVRSRERHECGKQQNDTAAGFMTSEAAERLQRLLDWRLSD